MKKIIACVVFVALVLSLLSVATEILTPKFENRYYILEDYLEDHPEDNLHDVKVFGSCHAYTSFNPVYMEEAYGISGFVYANAGEILPTTYARMVDQFKKHTPKVALVEIWGINPYETYSTQDRVFGFYLANNLERVGLSLAKQEVILDFQNKKYQDISLLTMNFPVMNYKDRLLDDSLTDLDFDYSFEDSEPHTGKGIFYDMMTRLKNNGYRASSSCSVVSYPEKQAVITPGESVEIEPDIAEYIWKIINLCKQKGVELIFYRSPYISTANELKKINHFKEICEEADVLFLDLEEEIQFDYKTDFLDYEHLSENGANKSTDFLMPYITEAMGEPLAKKEILRTELLKNGDFTKADNAVTGVWKSRFGADTLSKTEKGVYVDVVSAEPGWPLYQDIAGMGTFEGQSITAYFSIADCAGEKIMPLISFRDAEDKEIDNAKTVLVDGKCTVTGAVPRGTVAIRVGLFAYEGSNTSDFALVEKIELYQGAFTADTLPTVIN